MHFIALSDIILLLWVVIRGGVQAGYFRDRAAANVIEYELVELIPDIAGKLRVPVIAEGVASSGASASPVPSRQRSLRKSI